MILSLRTGAWWMGLKGLAGWDKLPLGNGVWGVWCFCYFLIVISIVPIN
jgi:hypothetical protein